MNTFFFTSSLCNAIQAEFNATSAKNQVQKRQRFLKQLLHWVVSLSSHPSFPAATFSPDAASGTRLRWQLWVMGEGATWSGEVGDRRSAWAQVSSQRHQEE